MTARVLTRYEKKTRTAVAANIQWMIDSHSLTVLELAAKAKVSKSQLCNVLACKSSPSTDFLSRIAQALGVGAYTLLE